MVFGNEWRVELGQDLNFLLDVLDLILRTFQVDDLNCDCLLGTLVIACKGAGCKIEWAPRSGVV